MRPCVVDHEVELFGRECRCIDIHPVVPQWQVVDGGRLPGFVEQDFRIVDADRSQP